MKYNTVTETEVSATRLGEIIKGYYDDSPPAVNVTDTPDGKGTYTVVAYYAAATSPDTAPVPDPAVDSDAKCNPVDSIGSSTKSRVSHSERRPSARFPGDKDGSARRNIEFLQ
jgi:hypothetical protein